MGWAGGGFCCFFTNGLHMSCVEETREAECDGCCCASDESGLDGAAKPAGAYEFAFEGAEDGEGCEGNDRGEFECLEVVFDQHVGKQGDKASGDIGPGDGERGADCAAGGGFFEAEFEAHHEIDPGGGILFEGVENGGGAGAVDLILLEDGVDLFLFVVGAVDDFALFALALGDVVLGVSAGGEVAAEAHGDGAGGDLGEAGEDDDVRGGDGSGETSGEGKGDGEAVGETDDDVAHGFGGLEVAFYVRGMWGGGNLMHGGSVVPDSRSVTTG